MKKFSVLFVMLFLIPIMLMAQRDIPANLREVLLDDFTTQRLGAYSGAPLFFPNMDADHTGQTLSVVGGQLKNTAAISGKKNMYFWNKDYLAPTCVWPDGSCYLRNRIQTGPWSTSLNRMSFRVRCDNTVTGSQAGYQNHLGTYARDPAYTNQNDQESNGWHFYHFINMNQSPWRWVWVTVNTHMQHMRANDGATDEAIPVNITQPTGNYYDVFTSFYFDRTYEYQWPGSTCYFDNWTLGTQTGEPDYHVSSLTYQYTGSHYEVAWQAGRTSGEVTTYDIRYSTTGSLKTAGFSTGTDAGTVASNGGTYRGVYWISANMSESSNGLWVGIRPRMPVQTATAAAPVSVGMYQHSLVTGDQVFCSGLGVTSNGNYTATVVDANNITLDSSSGSGTYSGNGYCKSTSDNSRFTEVFIPLAPLVAPGWPLGVSFSNTNTLATTVNFTPEYSATSTTAERRIIGQSWSVAGTTSVGSFTDNGLNPGTSYQYRLKSSNATGTGDYTDTHISHVYPTVTTTVDAAYPRFTTTSLTDPNVGSAYSKSLAATGGTAPYTFTVDSGTLPAGLSLSTAGVISGTPTTFVPLPGTAITFKVTDSASKSGYWGMYLPVNQLPAADNFNRADDWVYGDWSNFMFYGMRTYSNQLKPVGKSGHLRTKEWFSVDQWAEAKVTAIGAGGYIGPGVRADAAVGGYFCFQSLSQLCLTRWQLGGWEVNSTCADSTFSSGMTIRAEAFDTTIRCFANGTLKASISNADLLTGVPSIAANGDETTLADDYTAGNISTPVIITETLLDSVVNYSYSEQLTAARGVDPLVWSIPSGALPTGVTLSSSGAFSGTPTVAGTYTFTVRVTGADAAATDKSLTITVLAGVNALTVNTITLTEGRTALAYTHTLTASGGLTPYTWTLQSGTLPTGLSLSTAGVISGITNSAGTVSLTFRVTDRLNTTTDKVLSLTVLATTSATSDFNWGANPVGISGGTNGWYGSGIFTQGGTGGARVYDNYSYAQAQAVYQNLSPVADQYSQVKWKESVAGPIVRATNNGTGTGYACYPANGTLGVYKYANQYDVTSLLLDIPYTPQVDDVLKLTAIEDVLTCAVNGTTLLTIVDTTYTTGYLGIIGRQNGIVDDWEGGNIIPTPTINTASLASGVSGTVYNASLLATSGTPPYVWALDSGSLPTGLSLSSSGVISGTPSAVGVASFTVLVTDASALTDTQTLTLTIAEPPPASVGSRISGFIRVLGNAVVR